MKTFFFAFFDSHTAWTSLDLKLKASALRLGLRGVEERLMMSAAHIYLSALLSAGVVICSWLHDARHGAPIWLMKLDEA